jgi:hypothetical protein
VYPSFNFLFFIFKKINNQLGFSVKSCQNFGNTTIFFKKKKKKKSNIQAWVFLQILLNPNQRLILAIFFLFILKKMGIFKILTPLH